MAHTFGVGEDLFDFADENWGLVKRKMGNPIDSAVSKGGDGEYWPDTEVSYNERQEVTLLYRAKSKNDGLAVAISLGLACTSGYTPVSIKINTKIPGHAEIEITGHKHGAGTHAVNSIDISTTVNGWGATDFCSAAADEGCQSGSYSASIDHVDKLTRAGSFLCGRSQGCKVEVTASIIADTAPALNADLTDDGSDIDEGDDFYTASLKGHQYLVPA